MIFQPSLSNLLSEYVGLVIIIIIIYIYIIMFFSKGDLFVWPPPELIVKLIARKSNSKDSKDPKVEPLVNRHSYGQLPFLTG